MDLKILYKIKELNKNKNKFRDYRFEHSLQNEKLDKNKRDKFREIWIFKSISKQRN